MRKIWRSTKKILRSAREDRSPPVEKHLPKSQTHAVIKVSGTRKNLSSFNSKIAESSQISKQIQSKENEKQEEKLKLKFLITKQDHINLLSLIIKFSISNKNLKTIFYDLLKKFFLWRQSKRYSLYQCTFTNGSQLTNFWVPMTPFGFKNILLFVVLIGGNDYSWFSFCFLLVCQPPTVEKPCLRQRDMCRQDKKKSRTLQRSVNVVYFKYLFFNKVM